MKYSSFSRRPGGATWLLLGLILAGPVAAEPAGHSDGGVAVISKFAPATKVEIDSAPKPAIFEGRRVPAVRTVRIETAGRLFVLELVKNHRLVAGLRSHIAMSDEQVRIYRGHIRSVPGSWARVSIDEGAVRGFIWDGEELLLLDQQRRLEGMPAPAGDPDAHVIVRLADIELPLDQQTHPGSPTGKQSARGIMNEATRLAAGYLSASDTPGDAISLGIVIDTALANSISPVVQAAIEWANLADGIFTEQVGLHLDLEHILNLDGMEDPFTSTDPSTLLNELSAFKQANPDFAPLGIVHLLTRNDLDGEVRGVALQGAACDPSAGISLTEARGSTMDALIMTHEIAHNLGAPHDNEAGSPCEATPDGFLMSARLNSSRTFSECSVAQMAALIETLSCLVEVALSELRLDAPVLPTQLNYGERIGFDVLVHNTGFESVLNGQLDVSVNGAFDVRFTNASGRDCLSSISETDKSCDLDNLYAGETVTVSTEIIPTATGMQTIEFTVTASNDTDLSNNVASIPVEVVGATDARVDGVNRTSLHVRPGETIDYDLTVYNLGDFSADGVVSLRPEAGYTVSSTANCTVPQTGALDCDIGTLPAGGSSSFQVTVAVDPDIAIDPSETIEGSVDVMLTLSLPNTNMFPDSRLVFYVWGAVFDSEVEFTVPPADIDVGETRELVARLENFGPDAIPGGYLVVGAEDVVELSGPNSEAGTCEIRSEVWVACEFAQLDPGASLDMRVTYTGVSAGVANFSLSPEFAGGLESSQIIPSEFVQVEVSEVSSPPAEPPPPPPPPAPVAESAGGGGGSLSPLWLILLTLVRLARYFRMSQTVPVSSLRVRGQLP